MPIRRWSKIFSLGESYTDGIFDGPVSITEKVDGSQFNFGLCPKNGLTFLSKGSTCHIGDGNKLFAPAMSHVASVSHLLKEGFTYHGETLGSPRHNTLHYDRVPNGHVALYGISRADGSQISDYSELRAYADELGLDVVPELYNGIVDNGDALAYINEWLEQVSFLGKEKIEGVVITNYAKQPFLGGQLLPLMQAKFVSERFKERHKVAWGDTSKGPLTIIGEMVRTQPRWQKAIQKLVEAGTIEYHPRDIGGALKNLHLDIEEEDKELIKEKLWNAFSKDLKRAAVRGFPEAYKVFLVERMSNPEATIRMDITPNQFTEAMNAASQ